MPEPSRNAITYKDKYPPLTEMGLEVTILDNKKLGGLQRETDLDNAKFNGCIFEHNGRKLVCYRAYSELLGGKSNIFITVLDDELNPVSNHELALPKYSETNRQYEDARLFEHKGELYLSYVVVEYWGTDWKPSKFWSAIHVVKLDDEFNVLQHWIPHYGGNGVNNAQKNWIFFSDDINLYCIYNPRSHKVLVMDDDFNVKTVTRDKPILWPWGAPRGGTTPIRLDKEHWLAFFHSAIVHNQRKRRYSMTPYIFTKDKIVSVGRAIHASTENPIVDALATWWHPIVVFPMGIIADGEDFIVSVGVNDILTYLIKFPRAWVMDQKPAKEFHTWTPKYFFWNNATGFTHLTDYKILKVGGGGTMLKGKIATAEDYGYTMENYESLMQISKEDYDVL